MKAKLAKSHTTWIPEAEIIRDFARDGLHISKISAGYISPIGGGTVHAVVAKESGSLLIKIRGHMAAQDVRLYVKAAYLDEAMTILQDKITSLGWEYIKRQPRDSYHFQRPKSKKKKVNGGGTRSEVPGYWHKDEEISHSPFDILKGIVK